MSINEILESSFKQTREDSIRSTNLRLELVGEEIIKCIQKSRIRGFGHVMRMREELIPKNTLKKERRRPKGRPRSRWIDQIRKYIEMRGDNREEMPESSK